MFKIVKINLLIASLFSFTAFAADLTTGKIEVISTTPLSGYGIELNKVPSNVQTVKAEDLKRSQSLDITDYMNRNLTGVHINEIQNNPVQPDVNYRGFTASPLLGTPQGLSVYVDGVRMNQAFGDVVSWDLIPKNAISNMQLMPGSNPLFGLNTLGGALSIQTKDGRTSKGGALQTTIGSYGRKIGELEYGGVSKDNSVDYFFAGTYFDENGWRDHSDSNFGQFFGKLGWQGEKTDLKLTYAYANTDLKGNGMVPQNRAAYNDVFTWPDQTKNKSHLLNLSLAHYFNEKTSFTGNTYYKRIKTNTLNGDINDGSMPDVPGGYGQTLGTLYNVLGASPSKQCSGASGTVTEPGETCPGVINRTQTITDTYGLFGQFNFDNNLFSLPNKLVAGGGFEKSFIRFNQTAEYADIIERGMRSYGRFADLGEVDGNPENIDGVADDRRVKLKASSWVYSAYASDTLALTNKLSLTASARYNHTTVRNRDQINSEGHQSLSYDINGASDFNNDSLTGNHTFNRINPAIGATYQVSDAINLYGGYNEGSRAPTAMELTCADPEAPCKLPNSMAADPHLKQVVTKTFELGMRGVYGNIYKWNATVFNSKNYDDIQFIAAGSSGGGYFKNFGVTERKGLEGSFSAKKDKWSYGANYTYLEATYQSEETLNGNFNNSGQAVTGVERLSDASAGNTATQIRAYATTKALYTPNSRNITLEKGDHIPLIPKHIGKLFTAYDFSDKFKIGADALLISGSYVRGNENNEHQPGTVTYDCSNAIATSGAILSTAANTTAPGQANTCASSGDGQANQGTFRGVGKIAGYAIYNIFASYEVKPKFTFFGRVNNLLDKEYNTAGQLGQDPFNSSGNIQTSPYNSSTSNPKSFTVGDTLVAPGAPRSAWVGFRWEFD